MPQIPDFPTAPMPLPADSIVSRRSFLPLIPELDAAASLLAKAADALLAGEHDVAREHLRQADMPVVHEFASRIMGRMDREVHRYQPSPESRTVRARAVKRMPSAAEKAAIFHRDGFHCRYCGCRVVLASARDRMRALLPGAIRWARASSGQHAAFFALTATPDHVVPHALGGDNNLENLVTACWPCNFGRNSASLDEMRLSDPRQRPPVVDEWDGLGRVLPRRNAPGSATPSRVPAVSREAWLAELDCACPSASSRLLALVDRSRDLQVQWRLEKYFVVNVVSQGGLLTVLGIDPTGSVEVPWSIGSYKNEFRAFARTLADAIPGARVYPTPHMWRVKVGERNVNVSELLDASEALQTALAEFGRAVAARDCAAAERKPLDHSDPAAMRSARSSRHRGDVQAS